ncbi:MAG: LytR family transcriptional regulator [Candidatus Saccharibacteria bacterium]|nr:LytR family transcriptional regulator [Candidatus Saccharibacteria bacterium]
MDSSRFKRHDVKPAARQSFKKVSGGSIDGFGAPATSWRPHSAPLTSHSALTTRDRLRAEEAVAAPEPKKRTPIDMGLPGGESDFQAQMQVKTSRWRRIRPFVMRSSATLLVILLATGGFLGSQGYFKARKVFKGGTASAAALTANVDPSRLKGEGDGRVNILLLGRGGGTHQAPDLTDTIMLASIDPVNNTATLLSLPRDLWVDVPNFNAMKLNAVWESGKYKYAGKITHDMKDTAGNQAGFELVDQEILAVTGLPVHYNMLVDFHAFSQAIDTVGGVTVNVPTDLIDPTMAWENANNPVLAKAGVQAFDGKHALIYVRSRETTSDFARAQRQRSVLMALKDKVLTAGTLSNPVKLSGLMSSFADNAQTDLSLGDASRLVQIMKSVGSKVTSLSLAGDDKGANGFVTTGNMNGQSVVLPKAGLFNYGDIQTFIRQQLKDGYIVKEDSKILVLNGSTTVGLAATKAAELKTYGYNIVGAANAPTKTYTKTTIVDLSAGKYKYTKNYLEQRYKTTSVTTLPDATIQPNGADFVIILGSDASTSSQN